MKTDWTYLPILKWKQGERIALRELTVQQWEPIVPLLELPPIRCAPDLGSLRRELPGFMGAIAREMGKSIPENKPIAIDVRYVSPGYPRQVRLLHTICAGLAKLSRRIFLPVISEMMVSEETEDLIRLREFDEFVLRIQTPVTEAAQVSALAALAASAGLRRARIHLLIDQYSIVNEDAKARFHLVCPYLDEALGCGCASTTLGGGSFPMNLVGYKQGIHDIPRVEWQVWERVRKNREYSAIRYCDYTVSNPAPLPEIDPKQMNPSVAIRYAGANHWRLYKAGGFKKGKPNQYKALCMLLLGEAIYSGPGFSYGDACYDKAANGKLGNGNPSSWRRDATSHHLVLTASML